MRGRGTLHAFDRKVGGLVKRLPKWLYPFMELFTLLGQPPITVGISAAVFGYGLALNKPFYLNAGIIAIATITFSSLLKIPLRRARPDNEYVDKMFFKTYSFPSGHAAGAAMSYCLAAIVIGMRWPEWALRVWILSLVMTFFVSLSRIYLGAHFASDIIGGWAVAIVGLGIILFV